MRKQIKIIILSFATIFIFTAFSVNTMDVGIEDIPTQLETISTASPMVTVTPVEQIEEPEEIGRAHV